MEETSASRDLPEHRERDWTDDKILKSRPGVYVITRIL